MTKYVPPFASTFPKTKAQGGRVERFMTINHTASEFIDMQKLQGGIHGFRFQRTDFRLPQRPHQADRQ